MTDDYNDLMVSQMKYPVISKCMKDIYVSLNMDYIDYAGIKGKEVSNELKNQL